MVKIDPSKCVGCGSCVNDCVAGALYLENEKAGYTGECIHCGHCVAVCPTDAVVIPEYDMQDVEQWNAVDFKLDIGDLLHTIKFRRSARHYTERKIERDKLENIVQAGRYSATGSNQQACRFIVVQKELETLKEMVWSGIREMLANPPEGVPEVVLPHFQQFLTQQEQGGVDYLFRNAPAVVFVAAESPIDAGLAAQNMELAAVAQDLGFLYNGFLTFAVMGNPQVRQWMGAGDKPIQMCMLAGYPQKRYKRTAPRKKADVCWL